MYTTEQKLLFLNKINQSKLILFSKSSETLTSQNKQKEWTKLKDFAINFGMVNLANESWNYVRDTMWPNIKKATIKKVEKYNYNTLVDDIQVKCCTIEKLV
uniref:Uncharacterized protein n=1 Tax=Romanomermis culicivorax TaxID=13658 RepID=A0A915L8Y5_ROMCU